MRPKPTSTRIPSGNKYYILLVAFVNLVVLVTVHNIGRGKRPSYQLAYKESFGFFDDIEDRNWIRQKRKLKTHRLFYNRENPNEGANDSMALWMLNNVDPIFTCQHVIRVGVMGDGGKWTCDPHRLLNQNKKNKKDQQRQQDCLIYSIGSFGEYSFEDEISRITKKQCEIHVFDPDPQFARDNDIVERNISYHPWGLIPSYRRVSESTNRNQTYKSLPDMIQELGHEHRRIDIFKIDCDGCEWSCYIDWLPETIHEKKNNKDDSSKKSSSSFFTIDIRQILIETHPSASKRANVTVPTFFSDLYNSGFVPFSKEANTHPIARPMLQLFEMSFIRLDPHFFVV